MKIVHINAGNEYGGGLFHIISLLKQMKKREDVTLLVFEEGPVAQAARKENIPVHVLGQKSKFDIRFLPALKNYIKQNNFDVIHTHGPRANTYISRIIKALKPAKWVVTLHSNPELDFEDRGIAGSLFERLNVQALKRADFVISVSREIQFISQKYGVKSESSAVIHNGIEKREIPFTARQNSRFTLLSVGRLEKVKGHHLLFEALGQSRMKDWKLILCGDGSEREELEKLAEKKNILKNIEFAGWVEKEELVHYFRTADIFVLPSLSESFSLAALEAMEFHLPLVAADVGDVGLMFPEGTEAFLVEKNNAEELGKALETAFDSWKEERLDSISRLFYLNSEKFLIEHQVNETCSIYSEL